MNNKFFFLILILLGLACNKDDIDNSIPKPEIEIQVTELGHENIKIKSILKNYLTTNKGGIIWKEFENPDAKEVKVFESLSDTISSQVEDLYSGKEYFFRGFIINENDTIFSEEIKIKTGSLEKVNELVYSLDLAFDDRGVVVFETSDGGFVTGGYSLNYFGFRENRILLKKVTSDFENIWELVIEDYFSVKQIIEAPNKDLFLLVDGNPYATLMRISPNGSLIWTKEFREGSLTFLNDLTLFEDHLYLLGTTSSESGIRNGWFLKLDLNGNIIQNKTYSAEKFMIGRSLAILENSLYGVSDNEEGPMFAQFDLEGNLKWSKKIGVSGDFISDLHVIDNKFYLSGNTRRIGPGSSLNMLVLAVDKQGGVIWENGLGRQNWSFSLVTTPTNLDSDSYGNIYVTGIFGPGTPRMHTNLFLSKINSITGEEIWQKDLGNDEFYTYESGYGLTITDEDYLVVVGQKEDEEDNTISMTTNVWLQKFVEK